MEAANVAVGTTVQAAEIKTRHRSGCCSFVPCPDSLFSILKGQKKVSFLNNIATPSLLKCWLPWQQWDQHQILSDYLHVIFHLVIFSDLSKPLQRCHAPPWIRLFFLQTSSYLFFFFIRRQNGNDCSFLSVVFTIWNTHQGYHYSKL